MGAPDTGSPVGAGAPRGERRRPPRRAAALVAAGLLAVTGGCLLAAGLTGEEPELGAAGTSAQGAAAPEPALTVAPRTEGATAPEEEPQLTAVEPQPTAAPAQAADADVRLRVPSVGIDLPVHPLEPDGGAINPPTMTDAYWIDPYGRPGAGASAPDNTVYIAAHSWSRGEAAFDPLLDADFRGGAVGPGDRVEVETPSGTAEYAITDVRRYGKGELPDADEVWAVHPGRLVLITCFQREDGGRSTENLVVTAELAGDAAR
ncbi:class F sortase [uncultured Pseudokineococcus sp.]|uniref:class F sortase n=1 Tax=uncultured Pseudokineococcus sp. TaxID=1642928 RepID=UPI00261A1183|nr:class F sortase [uncultured Pseudokineococcus sp.]